MPLRREGLTILAGGTVPSGGAASPAPLPPVTEPAGELASESARRPTRLSAAGTG